MAVGYPEPHFVLNQEHVLHLKKATQRLQIRAEVLDLGWENMMSSMPASLRPHSMPRGHSKYIAVETFNAKGKQTEDLLLMYSAGGGDRLMADWVRLMSEPDVDIDDLSGWCMKVYDHSTGYFRDGSTRNYQ